MRSTGAGVVEAGDLRVSLENASFDGASITGRLLIGTKSGRIVNQGEWPVFGLLVESATKCGGSDPLQIYVVCGGRIAPQATQPSTSLYGGDWYGRDIRDLAFLEAKEDCVTLKGLIPGAAVGEPGRDIVLLIRAERSRGVSLLSVSRSLVGQGAEPTKHSLGLPMPGFETRGSNETAASRP
jgi:hypothetical protein